MLRLQFIGETAEPVFASQPNARTSCTYPGSAVGSPMGRFDFAPSQGVRISSAGLAGGAKDYLWVHTRGVYNVGEFLGVEERATVLPGK